MEKYRGLRWEPVWVACLCEVEAESKGEAEELITDFDDTVVAIQPNHHLGDFIESGPDPYAEDVEVAAKWEPDYRLRLEVCVETLRDMGLVVSFGEDDLSLIIRNGADRITIFRHGGIATIMFDGYIVGEGAFLDALKAAFEAYKALYDLA